MTDSFFDFSNLAAVDRTFEEDDDTDYDALNSETFGEGLPETDWEEDHEQLASELEKRSFDDENNELTERMASYVLDDEGEDIGSNATCKTQPTQKPADVPPQGPLKWWMNGAAQNTAEQPKTLMDMWWHKPQPPPVASIPAEAMAMPSKPVKILTVEELEEKMRKEAAAALAVRPSAGFPPAGAHLEEVERDMHHMPKQMQNGNYGRGRGGAIPRGRYQAEVHHEQPYHAVHHPFPPFPRPAPMIRPPPPVSRHQGQLYPRYYDGRILHPQPAGRVRHPRPVHHPYLQNQQPSFRRVAPQPPIDEFAGLMSPQEKQWLASIQMMQLNTHQPFQDDFYYLMYQQRQVGSGRKMSGTHNHKREQLPHKPAAAYTPLQFENSLGKLQIGSVTAPRKIIETELVETMDHNTKQSDRKSKQILLEIEEMYHHVLQIEDAFNPLNTNRKDFDMISAQEKLLNLLIPEGKLAQIMSIRKGKKVVLRMLPNMVFPASLLHRLMMDLVPITRKDTENNMLLFLPSIRNYLQGVNLETLVEITNNYDDQFLLSNKFTVSVMANLIERADQVRSECMDVDVLEKWNQFLFRLIESTQLWSHTERPVVAVDRDVLERHLAPVLRLAPSAEATRALILTLQTAKPKPASSEPPKI